MQSTKAFGRGMLSQYESVGGPHRESVRGRLVRLKLRSLEYLKSFDLLVMQKYFGGATPEDEQREQDEKDLEEQEALRIFAELHRDRLAASQFSDAVSVAIHLNVRAGASQIFRT